MQPITPTGQEKENSVTNLYTMQVEHSQVPDGLAVRICGSHPQGPGSTPGLGIFLFNSKSKFIWQILQKVVKIHTSKFTRQNSFFHLNLTFLINFSFMY